ncbi:DUF3427 domain-containing protein [Corynebacterium epidermidicanis]|uniref:DNA/RNA helicase, superfamily II n=1 Tax=Corynebacterium epidermidicanis TaxID=1050174 RepID=A0A0G3GQK9_9CORY|nr:DEAD/DEAH box helicase [Corynebacterium epidermidicanis]AKK02845.1 DNA/RNA helicase, superfamily II [Corynebacterium epidermidicanis]
MSDQLETFHSDLKFGFVDRETTSNQLFDPRLIANNDDERTMLAAITNELRTCDSFRFSIAFITPSGLALLKNELLKFKGTGTIITSRYLDFNEPSMFRELLNLKNIQTRIYDHPKIDFHAKGYIFEQSPILTAIVGSSNLTDNALVKNQEWNLRFSTQSAGNIAYQIDDAINRQLEFSTPLSEEWIRNYEITRRPSIRPALASYAGETLQTTREITPNPMQMEALSALAELREMGAKKAVIVSATGTGKTILAALAAKEFNPKRVLFVVHREQIAAKALYEFQRVFGGSNSDYGRFTGATRQQDCRFVFATTQTLAQPETLATLSAEHFDFVIIDESHHSGAATFRRVIDHFEPEFLLGLTATPERTDKFNIFELFDYNVAYEIRLQRALEEKMLVPFHYFGVADYTLVGGDTVTETTNLAFLASNERVKFVAEKLEKYGLAQNVHGLMFCSRKDEAHELARLFNDTKVYGKLLRTVALTGEDSREDREKVVTQLENGEIDYIITVDIFNEGIDIPCINQIVMLRATQSSIIFTQQLGRGLRKSEGKDHLRVIDFIGNYANNFLIPIALFGDNSRSKDSLRRKVINPDGRGRKAISGVSSVNFDEIAEARVLESLAKAKMTGKQEFKKDILAFQQRHNRLPRLIDFARFDLVDPVLISTKYGNYWSLLSSLKFVNEKPTDEHNAFLNFLSMELLNGKRPQELLLLKQLISQHKVTSADFAHQLVEMGTQADESHVESAIRMLTYQFPSTQQLSKYGKSPLITSVKGVQSLSPKFAACYREQPFQEFVDDIIETGLYLSRHRHSWSGNFVIGERYSRKDACRLLNWPSNVESIMYGYKVDEATATCPIFVTYHKSEDVEASVSYEDKFKDPATLHWFTKSRRTLTSPEVSKIISKSVDLHIFVKKDDAEGTDFYYLGTATPANPVQTTMPDKAGSPLNVVSMDLILDQPISPDLYNYFESTTP